MLLRLALQVHARRQAIARAPARAHRCQPPLEARAVGVSGKEDARSFSVAWGRMSSGLSYATAASSSSTWL
eukprot:10907133-Alexandrium_andersonii.AAC.1